MKPASLLALSTSLALAVVACGKADEGASSGSSGSLPPITVKPAAKTRVEKVTMGGVRWEVTLPDDMLAPQYKVNQPEFLGPDDLSLTLDGTFPKFDTVEGYVERNVATKVLEKKQVGEAWLVVTEPQAHNAGKLLMTGIVLGKNIGWRCSGSKTRETDIRAMCASVKFSRE